MKCSAYRLIIMLSLIITTWTVTATEPDRGSTEQKNDNKLLKQNTFGKKIKPSDLSDAELAAQKRPQADIPISFTLENAGYVTLVIDNQEGMRICNLINDTWFEAGSHTLYWDGYNVGEFLENDFADLRRTRVPVGTYTLRGLIHDDIKLKFEVVVQSPGSPPWRTPDGSGGWMADHTPPGDVLFLPKGSPLGDQPQIIAVASGAEAGHGSIWIDTRTGNKLFGLSTGIFSLTADPGPDADKSTYAYALSKQGINVLAMVDVNKQGDKLIRLKRQEPDLFKGDSWEERSKYDIAAYNCILLVNFASENVIRFYDMRVNNGNNMLIASQPLEDARGMTFDSQGNLYVLIGKTLQKFTPDLHDPKNPVLGKGTVVVEGLEDPRRVLRTQDGMLCISDWGSSHQVKLFNVEGKFIRVIGKPGGQQFGLYEETRMCRPLGMAIDNMGRLWVAELNYAPKRISMWDIDSGQLLSSLYGPPKYGGGGHWDTKDPSRFYYSSGLQGIEFKVDWKTGESKPRGIYYLEDSSEKTSKNEVLTRCPDTSVYVNGRHYMINSFFGSSYFADAKANIFLFDDKKCTATPVLFVGYPGQSVEASVFKKAADADPVLKSFLEEKVFTKDKRAPWRSLLVIWSDLNLDGIVQVEEIQHRMFDPSPDAKRGFQAIIFNDDLSIATGGGVKIPAPSFNENGAPVYDMNQFTTVPRSYHLTDVVLGDDGNYIFTMGHFASKYREMLAYKGGVCVWRINGLKKSPAEYKGNLVNCQRNIGFPFTPPVAKEFELFALNGYRGNIPVITTDGLYVTDLGGDVRDMPMLGNTKAEKGMIVDNLSWGEEHFWPAIDQLADGRIIFTAGERNENIAFEVLNLDSLKKIPSIKIPVTESMLTGKSSEYIQAGEYRTLEKSLNVLMKDLAPVVDGKIDDWENADWVEINPRVKSYASVAIHGDMLYAIWKTSNAQLLNNNIANGLENIFSTGGGLDLMIRTNPDVKKASRASHKRISQSLTSVTYGDIRIFITRLRDPLSGPIKAVLFQQIGGKGPAQEYVSPVGQSHFDSVSDVSEYVKLSQLEGVYEISIPLSVIGLNLSSGSDTIGDIGIITGNGSEALNRTYWNNRASTMVSDIPTESLLLPYSWGKWVFKPEAEISVPKQNNLNHDANK